MNKKISERFKSLFVAAVMLVSLVSQPIFVRAGTGNYAEDNYHTGMLNLYMVVEKELLPAGEDHLVSIGFSSGSTLQDIKVNGLEIRVIIPKDLVYKEAADYSNAKIKVSESADGDGNTIVSFAIDESLLLPGDSSCINFFVYFPNGSTLPGTSAEIKADFWAPLDPDDSTQGMVCLGEIDDSLDPQRKIVEQAAVTVTALAATGWNLSKVVDKTPVFYNINDVNNNGVYDLGWLVYTNEAVVNGLDHATTGIINTYKLELTDVITLPEGVSVDESSVKIEIVSETQGSSVTGPSCVYDAVGKK